MPIAATTLATLREAIRDRIETISPDHPHESSREWRRLANKREVPGTIRGYFIEAANERPKLEGGLFTSSWATYEADLKIWTGYGSLTDEQWEDAKSSDGRQLWVALSRVGGAITGLINVAREPWEDGETAEASKRWGAHVFRITYLLEQP